MFATQKDTLHPIRGHDYKDTWQTLSDANEISGLAHPMKSSVHSNLCVIL